MSGKDKARSTSLPGEGHGEAASSSSAAYVVGNDILVVLFFGYFGLLLFVLLRRPPLAPPSQNTSKSSRTNRCTTVPSSCSSLAKTAVTRTEASLLPTVVLPRGRDAVEAVAGARLANMIPATCGTTICCVLFSSRSQNWTDISSAKDVSPQPIFEANPLSLAISLARAGRPGTTDFSKSRRASKPSGGSVQHA